VNKSKKDSFVNRDLSELKLWLTDSDDELGKLGQERLVACGQERIDRRS
jgi:hypothetical protein